jgi:hypothetical protein
LTEGEPLKGVPAFKPSRLIRLRASPVAETAGAVFLTGFGHPLPSDGRGLSNPIAGPWLPTGTPSGWRRRRTRIWALFEFFNAQEQSSVLPQQLPAEPADDENREPREEHAKDD